MMLFGPALWATPEIVGIGRLPMRPPLDPYSDAAGARAAQQSPWVASLDGMWDFRLVDSPEWARPDSAPVAADAHHEVEWERVAVPGSWVLPPTGRRGATVYTNVVMPFDQDPPAVPKHNPTGIYRRAFRLATGWRARRTLIEIGSAGSTLAIRDWLDDGGLVGLLGDRWLPTTHGRDSSRGGIVELPFLGQPARFIDGPLRLAMLLKRRVLFMAGPYLGGNRYDLRFEVLADFTDVPREAAAREAALAAAVAAYVARLEALCREAPYNWFNFFDFWDEERAA